MSAPVRVLVVDGGTLDLSRTVEHLHDAVRASVHVDMHPYGWNDAWQRMGVRLRDTSATLDAMAESLILGMDLASPDRRRPSRGWRRHERRRKATERRP